MKTKLKEMTYQEILDFYDLINGIKNLKDIELNSTSTEDLVDKITLFRKQMIHDSRQMGTNKHPYINIRICLIEYYLRDNGNYFNGIEWKNQPETLKHMRKKYSLLHNSKFKKNKNNGFLEIHSQDSIIKFCGHQIFDFKILFLGIYNQNTDDICIYFEELMQVINNLPIGIRGTIYNVDKNDWKHSYEILYGFEVLAKLMYTYENFVPIPISDLGVNIIIDKNNKISNNWFLTLQSIKEWYDIENKDIRVNTPLSFMESSCKNPTLIINEWLNSYKNYDMFLSSNYLGFLKETDVFWATINEHDFHSAVPCINVLIKILMSRHLLIKY